MRVTAALCALSFLALSACDPAGDANSSSYGTGSTTGTASSAAVLSANCEAEVYQYLVGGPIDLAQEVTYGGIVRILGPDEFLTKDFNPSRLTITTAVNRSGDNVVGRVFCG